ncbi:SMI1/KNR4 family protein [Clostridium chrysemydis]|uniref:SMI1/KNR4 family protein n=1 Tax=Clostridium chrysemydis TaxID=2665504 RepID=UPI001883435F|nr:SMI1/KNR4 family protein [Clostridium chrysemydis]
MYMELINKLKHKGIEFEIGLSNDEIKRIEEVFNIEFPKDLKELYKIALPISKGFYNWRNFNDENVTFINEVIKRPIKDIYELADGVYWCDEWGEEPNNELEKVEIIRSLLKKAPKLIPIYAHRYMPQVNRINTPIFSIHDTDIICYGENLTSYLEIEFGTEKQSDINYEKLTYIPFWSDLL